MSIVLKVDPEILKAKAEEVSSQIKKVEGTMDDIQKIVANSTGYWIGAAGDKARKSFKNMENEARTVIKRFNEHPKDLLTMAGVYSETERQLTQFNQRLETDIIV